MLIFLYKTDADEFITKYTAPAYSSFMVIYIDSYAYLKKRYLCHRSNISW